MSTIRNLFLLALTALAVATTSAQENAAAKKDTAQLQGEWTMVAGERDGQPFPADFLKGSKRVAKGDETTVMLQGQLLLKAKFTLDPAKSPKTIDYAVTGGPHTGKTQLGIYELGGDTVKFCFSIPGKERPTGFSTKPNDGRTLSTWKRAQSGP
jgi:uncharacterized protein (TIGR03067 family)